VRLRGISTSGVVLAAALAGCTVVAPGGPDGGDVKIIPIPIRPDALPEAKPLKASVLVVANLQRSSANLADQYSSLILGMGTYFQSVGLELENIGLIATYADRFGPRLLLGRKVGVPTTSSQVLLAAIARAADAGATDYESLLPFLGGALGNVADEDLPRVLKILASSGNFDGVDPAASEAEAVIKFGRGLGGEALPAIQGGIARNALFDKPRDLFIVVYLQPLGRHCAMDSPACLVDGRTPADIFTETDAAGNAAWLKFASTGINAQKVLHVAIATTEGETLTAFRTRCMKVPGIPLNLFDVMAPSNNPFFVPLMASLNSSRSGTGHIGDFCELISDMPEEAIKKLGTRVAATVGSR
jgi:hypothetical protein